MTTQQRPKPRIVDRWWGIAGIALIVWVAMRLAVNGLDAWPSAVVGGVGACGVVTWRMMRRRRKDATAIGAESDAVPTLDRRIIKEELPDDPAEREAMGRLVRRRLGKIRRNQKWALPMMAVFCFLPAVLWFSSGRNASGGLAAAFGAAFFVWLVWMNRRVLGRLTRMDERIGGGRQSPAIR
ncbi:hypothetical protein [Streptomyces sp. SPB162]|uniref:hypothetical protein n=1 Tax=Streptomyces sp. SPB162 TaxID=2940560 RepID=UPI002404F6A3|nr:hypothetical protein [Streptomyces sp. SPB162]MDF9810905.1 Flp pilus assembly protein TadB [Streptomyces sp. SPB162]